MKKKEQNDMRKGATERASLWWTRLQTKGQLGG